MWNAKRFLLSALLYEESLEHFCWRRSRFRLPTRTSRGVLLAIIGFAALWHNSCVFGSHASRRNSRGYSWSLMKGRSIVWANVARAADYVLWKRSSEFNDHLLSSLPTHNESVNFWRVCAAHNRGDHELIIDASSVCSIRVSINKMLCCTNTQVGVVFFISTTNTIETASKGSETFRTLSAAGSSVSMNSFEPLEASSQQLID